MVVPPTVRFPVIVTLFGSPIVTVVLPLDPDSASPTSISLLVPAKVIVPPGVTLVVLLPSEIITEGPDNLLLAMFPVNLLLVIPRSFTLRASLLVSIVLSSTFTAKT